MNKVYNNPIAEIIKGQWSEIMTQFNSHKIRTFSGIKNCRTPALGGSLYSCNSCGQFHKRYHSCRNRNCPTCQNTQKEQWILQRQQPVLPCKYFHVVFTIPHQLNELVLSYQRSLYKILFDTSWQCFHLFGWNEKYLGAKMGAIAVLHTWGSNMSFHPHIHCIVPSAGLTLKNKWKAAKGYGKFLFPVKALSKVFKAIFLKQLRQFCDLQGLDNTAQLFIQLSKKDGVVYAKPPFGGTNGVIRYLARYTHKIAITNHRIIKYDNNTVTFSFTDYRHRNQKKQMTLSSQEFVRRFALHILPKGFVRIRHYGILSSSYKKNLFPDFKAVHQKTDWIQLWKTKGLDVLKCPHCKNGLLQYIGDFIPKRGPPLLVFTKSSKSKI